MSDEGRLEEMRLVSELLGITDDVSQEPTEARVYCTLHPECEANREMLTLKWQERSYYCSGKGESGSLRKLIKTLESRQSERLPASTNDGMDAEPEGKTDYSLALRTENAVLKTKPQVLQLKPEQKLPSPEEIKAAREIRLEEIRAARAERRRGAGEKLIVILLALVFLVAGLMAAGLSGFANYNAFASTVADPAQGRIWGAAGIIAAIVSFGGFTFVYWHAANRRRWESLRSLVFALIGAGASILGTEIYIHSNNLSAAAEVSSAATNRDVLQTQVADWRRQLEDIPPETRSVEGLEAYIAEVERVGRTEQKPYRDAQNELGLAKRRDELNAKIEAANAELLGQGSGNILLQAEQRASLPSWLFAVLLELFSSQATSIGLVALLILTRRRPDQSANG
jgi:hypothetical protein